MRNRWDTINILGYQLEELVWNQILDQIYDLARSGALYDLYDNLHVQCEALVVNLENQTQDDLGMILDD